MSPAGPHPFPKEAEWHYSQHRPFIADYPTKKRSIYLMQQRIRKQPFLEIFDGADTNGTTGVRPISTTPMNNEFAHDEAAKLAERVSSASDDGWKIDRIYRLVLGRPATVPEIEENRAYLSSIREALRQTETPTDHHERQALASFARVLMSSNEFLFVE